MKKNILVAPKRGGKTQYLIAMMQVETDKGHKCYYLGGQKHYDELLAKINKQGLKIELALINKDVTPTEDDCAVFTDNITWEMTSIFPYAVRAMTKLHGNWYSTISEEDVVVVEPETKLEKEE